MRARTAWTVIGCLIGSVVFGAPAAVAADDGVVTGTVWFDRNRDGVRQADEPARPGALVQVMSAAPGAGGHGVTDRDGRYEITLPAGSHQVGILGYDVLPTTPGSVSVTVGPGGRVTADFGVDGGTITGRAWLDGNGDGVRQDGEAAMPGVDVVVGGVRTRTGPDGSYRVDDLTAGEHHVMFHSRDPELAFTTHGVPGDPARDSDVTDSLRGAAVNLSIGNLGVEDAVHVDAGYVRIGREPATPPAGETASRAPVAPPPDGSQPSSGTQPAAPATVVSTTEHVQPTASAAAVERRTWGAVLVVVGAALVATAGVGYARRRLRATDSG